MLLDLADPASIISWWLVWPERHDPFLEHWTRSRPEFSASVREAQRRIAADPELSAMLVRAAVARRMTAEAPEVTAERVEDLCKATL